MVATPSIETSQGYVTVLAEDRADEIRLTQTYVTALASLPAENAQTSQTFATVLVGTNRLIDTSQTYVTALVAGRVFDPVVRAWTFTLDGHDYYVLRLGNNETLVYDTHSEQWYVWGSGTTNLWKAYNGCNWLGVNNFTATYGSNVVVGDDANGSIYLLNPENDTDDDSVEGAGKARSFERIVQGQVTVNGYDAVPCYGFQLEGSIGSLDIETLNTVNLKISDDRGNTYTDLGDISITQSDYAARVHWRSLGKMTTPGRLFQITDFGALRRIDALAMDDGE